MALPLTDEQILADLQTHKPVGPDSEKNIWAFWDKGIASVKPWCQRNIISWARRHLSSGWTVRVLDMVPSSPNHYSKFIPNTIEYFPEAFIQAALTGTHKGPHAADLIRLPLIQLHGGVWLDVGFMLFTDLDRLCWNKLADPSLEKELAGFKMPVKEGTSMMWNGFIACRKGSILVKHWHDSFLKLWEGKDSTFGMYAHPLLRHLPSYEVPPPPGGKPAFKYSDYVDYLIHMYVLERVRNMDDPSLDGTGPEYFAKHTYLLDVVAEVYWAQIITGWDGGKQFELLSRQREGATHDESWKESENFLQGVLDTSSTMKLGHGIVTDLRDYLARIWDQPENHSADIAEGTFAARLRWASVHYEQTKELKEEFLSIRDDAQLSGKLFETVGKPHPEVFPETST